MEYFKCRISYIYHIYHDIYISNVTVIKCNTSNGTHVMCDICNIAIKYNICNICNILHF